MRKAKREIINLIQALAMTGAILAVVTITGAIADML